MTTRERIIKAATEAIRSHGLVRATTRQIAKAAGLSEGALYKHFASKSELLLEVLKSSDSDFVTLVMRLPQQAGKATVEANLARLAAAALAFYRESIPAGGSLFADPELLEANREVLRSSGAGPRNANRALTRYLAEEQRIGRVAAEVDAEACAGLLLGAVFYRAYLMEFLGEARDPAAERRFLENTAASFLRVLEGPSETRP